MFLTKLEDIKWMKVKELTNYLYEHLNVDVGFTSDTREDVEGGVEPKGWYGVAVMDMFDENVTVFGYYGGGIEYIYNPHYENITDGIFTKEATTKAIIDFFQTEFNMEIDEDYEICVDKSDVEGVIK